jgi:hypothetical protein
MRFIILVLFSLLLIAGCRQEYLSPKEFMNWILDDTNGLSVSNEGELFKYTLRYRPATEIALIETGPNYTQLMLDSLVKRHEGLEYYLLKLESKQPMADVLKAGVPDETAYYERLNYLTFDVQSDIAIVTDGDTSMCSLYHLERNYGTAPYLKMLLAFPSVDTGFVNEREVLLYSRIEPMPQLIKFSISNNNIHSIPKLKTKG